MAYLVNRCNSYFSYKPHNKMLIYNLNSLNIIGTLYIIYKCDVLHSLPNLSMCITSSLFWSNPKDNYIRKYDYLFVVLSILSANIHSINNGTEHIVGFSYVM